MKNGYIELPLENTGMEAAKEQLKRVFGRLVRFDTFVIKGGGSGFPVYKGHTGESSSHLQIEYGWGQRIYSRLRLLYFKGRNANTQTRMLFSPEMGSESNSGGISGSQSQKTGEGAIRKRILVAEDNDSNALLIAAALRHDYEIIRAVNGLEAVEKYHSERPDLILMDIKMPDMDGFEATQIIRQSDAQIPIIAVTAFAFDSDRERALEIGCTEYLAKPIIPGNLRKLIKQYI